MVQVVRGNRGGGGTATGSGPVVHIHYIERSVHGNGVAVKVYGELKIAAKEYVYARELKLNTIQVLLLTCETGNVNNAYTAQKYVHNKGEYDNYASIDVFVHNVAADTVTEATRGGGPADGSIWLNFMALGE